MITNFFRIEISEQLFSLQRIEYSEELLKKLRSAHNHEASFFRCDDYIFISRSVGSALELGERVTLDVAECPDLVASLIRHMIFRGFRDAFPDRVPESFAPLRFCSQKDVHDPMRALLPENLRNALGFPRIVELHVRSLTRSGLTEIGVIINSRHRWRFSASADGLEKSGFSIAGSTVVETVPIPGLSGVLAPDENVVGFVTEVNGDVAMIQTNAGTIFRPLKELQLQRTREQIGRYLNHFLGEEETTNIFQQLREEDMERANPAFAFGEVRKMAGWFAKQRYENADGFSFGITVISEFQRPGFRLSPTTLVFDYGPGASSSKPSQGLGKWGPFDSNKFDRKDLRMLALFHERSRGAATSFLKRLIEGIPENRYFEKGMCELYRLHRIDHTLKSLGAQFPEDYEEAIDAAIKEAGGKGFDIAIVECPDDSETFPPEANPYLRAKARLMSYGIPVQGVAETKLRASSGTVAFTLGTVALQMYAKAGGTPWLLPSSQSVDREIIIGIGNTIDRPNLWADAEQSRVVGLTTFFLGDGRYLLGQELRSVPYADYFKILLQSVEASLRDVSAEYAWKDGETIRLVFHVFKPLKDIEIDVVDELIGKFPQFNIVYAFVTISTKHPWMIYRDARVNAGKWQVTLCERGDNFILDDTSCLVQLRGPNDRANRSHRPPRPVLVRLHQRSTFRDLQYLTQQIQDFSFLSWRSFFPSDTPVTIFYSELMARMSNKLRKLRNWNPLFLDQHFRRKKWFL